MQFLGLALTIQRIQSIVVHKSFNKGQLEILLVFV